MALLPEFNLVQLTSYFNFQLGIPQLLADRYAAGQQGEQDDTYSLYDVETPMSGDTEPTPSGETGFLGNFVPGQVFYLDPQALGGESNDPFAGDPDMAEVDTSRRSEWYPSADGELGPLGVRAFAIDEDVPPPVEDAMVPADQVLPAESVEPAEPVDVAEAASTPMAAYEMDQGMPDMFEPATAEETATAFPNLLGFDINSTQPIEGWVNVFADGGNLDPSWTIWGEGATGPVNSGWGWY